VSPERRPRPPERDYSHRDVVDKLGVKPGHVVAFDESEAPVDPDLRERVLTRAGRPAAEEAEPADVVLIGADANTDARAVLGAWKPRLVPNGGIWLLTPKRTQPGYVDQRLLIEAGLEAGLVDNKVVSVSETTSAMRWVIRRRDRAAL
jgi:hypothetical protein